MRRLAFRATILSFAATSLLARDFHVMGDGAGSRDGSDWENAMAIDRLETVFNDTMQAGDRLVLGSGRYEAVTLAISRGGEPGRPKEIVGVDRGEGLPVFVGDWTAEHPAKGSTAIRLESGASHVAIRGVRIRGYVFGVRAPEMAEGGARSHLEFDDIRMERIRYGFFLADCDDVLFRDCVAKRYTKHAFRFDQGCDRVRLERCVADCSEGDRHWETKTELFPFGYFLGDSGRPNTAFVFEDCVASNNVMPLQTTKYKNGDGFVVESNASEVTFVRCRAIRNQDGGFDLKTRDVRLSGCVAVGNSRGFRIWTTAELDNCLAGWGAVGLWANGGPVRVSRSTFHMLSDAAVLTDDAAAAEVTLVDSLVTATPAAQRNTAQGTVALQRTMVAVNSDDIAYKQPPKEWNGEGTAMDCVTHPEHGYRGTPPAGARQMSR